MRITAEMQRTLVAAADRILPADDWPGATDAHVFGYIQWVTRQPSFVGRWSLFSRGIGLLDSIACAMFALPFADCSNEQQDEVLHRLQSIPHPTAQRFLVMLVNMTLAGYFCNPKYGGNRNGIVWGHMRFEPDPTS